MVWVTSFTQKIPESSDFIYSSYLMLENIWYHHFTWTVPNSQEIVNLFQFSLGPRRPTNRKKVTPNGHIFVDSPLIRRWNSTWKVRGNYIDFERRIHVESMASIRRGNCYIDSIFKINETSMSSPRGFFSVVSTSNRRNSCTCCFRSIIS